MKSKHNFFTYKDTDRYLKTTTNMKNLAYRSIGAYLNTLTKILPRTAGRKGFELFCQPQRTRLAKNHIEFLGNSRQLDFDFNGINIKTYHWGYGPRKVLFVHGWQSHSYRWKKYIEQFPADQFTLIAYDAPGHGQSAGNQFTVPLNAYLIAELAELYSGFEVVVAHSIGSISVLYALAHYHHIDIKRVVAMASPSKVEEFFAFYVKVLRLKPHTIRQIRNEFQIHVKQNIGRINLAAFAARVNIPGLIIHDEDDPETPYYNALELLASWRGSHLVTTKGLGHNLRSEIVVKAVTDYVTHGHLPNTARTTGNSVKSEFQIA